MKSLNTWIKTSITLFSIFSIITDSNSGIKINMQTRKRNPSNPRTKHCSTRSYGEMRNQEMTVMSEERAVQLIGRVMTGPSPTAALL